MCIRDRSTIAEKYQKEHLSELQELYKSKGQQVMIEKIYADIAPQYVYKRQLLSLDPEALKHINEALKIQYAKEDNECLILQ